MKLLRSNFVEDLRECFAALVSMWSCITASPTRSTLAAKLQCSTYVTIRPCHGTSTTPHSEIFPTVCDHTTMSWYLYNTSL
eukprot:761477-Amphidinium_carterae.1